MKKYIFQWYNFKIQMQQTDIIMAENEIEAEAIAKAIVKFRTGEWCDPKSAIKFHELSDNDCYTMKKIKEEYASNKEIDEFIEKFINKE